MTLAVARVTLKQHRFEVGSAAFAAILFGLWALLVEVRIGLVSVPPGCFDKWIAAGSEGAGDCAGSVRAWGSVLVDEGPRIIAAMAYLPFAIGLLAGVPTVARELESRTAQTAWWLNPSRVRWLLRQITPVLILVGVGVTFAAVTTGALEADRVIWGYSPVEDLGNYGPVIVARAFGAYGIGLLVGALLGRTLPAFVFGGILTIALVFTMNAVHDAWLKGLAPVLISEGSGSQATTLEPDAVITTVAWRTPDGRQLSLAEARTVAHAAGVAQPSAGDVQDSAALAWLELNGYVQLALGATREMALSWGAYDGLGFCLVSLVSMAGTVLLVNKKRPT